MTWTTVVTFEGCQTHEQALTRVAEWLDRHIDGQVRAHLARVFAELPCEDLKAEEIQLRAYFAGERDAVMARVTEILATIPADSVRS